MATGDDQDELTKEFKDISLNSDMGGCAGKSDNRMEKDKSLKENSKFPSHTARVLRIGRVTSLNDVKKEKQAIEKNTNCSILLAKKEEDEPSYYKSWFISNNRSIVIAEGNVENSVTDIIVCPIDEHCQPAGESAEHIFQKGGWTELENAAIFSKTEHEKTHGTGDTNWLYSSSTTGSLNCRRIWFVYIKKLRDSMEVLSNTLYDEVEKNYWRSIYFPVESNQIKDETIQKMTETFLKRSASKPLTGMEIVLCVPSGSRDCEQLDAICKESLKGRKVISFYNETRSNVDEYIPCSCFPSPFEVKIEIESILDIAKKGEVDVIVNSTNQNLILKEGHVSSLILEHGGPQIQKECRDHDYINEGDIVVSNAGKLHCKKIIHCVLINWISTGNLSLKVLSSLVKKCLKEMDNLGLETIAFPALGTGKLEYPYIHVARTMQKAVYEYGILFPRTCIKKVIFALYKEDRECIKTFQDVHDSDQIVKDFILNPTIQFLENRISKSGLLIQLMSQEINEPVDAIINFTSVSSKYGHGEQGDGGPVNLTWCKEKGCYTGTYKVGQEMKLLVEECFTKLEFMKITSTRIDIRDIDATKGFETVMNAFCDNFSTAVSRSTKTNTNKNQVRYLKKLQILARQAEIEKVKKSQQKKSAETDSIILKKWHAFWNNGECEEKWKVVEKTRTKCVVCCVRGPAKDVVENAWEQLKIKVGAYIQGVGRWCFCQNYKWKLESKICNIKLIEAEEKDMNEVDITNEDGITHTYNFDELQRTQKNPTGDVRKEKIQFIHGCETSPKSAMWTAFHKGKWIFLPMQCCRVLNSAAEKRMNDTYSQNNVYDLNKMQRKLQNNGSNHTYEDILCIEAVAEKTKHFTESDVKIENEHKADFSVFEIVTGVIMHSEEYGNDVLKIVKDSGCFVMNVDNNSSVQISGSLEGIEKVNLHLTKKKEGNGNTRNSEEGTDYRYVIAIPMSERDYEAVSYFGNKYAWFKTISNNVKYIDGSLCVIESDVVDGQDIENKLDDLIKKVQSMAYDNIPVENKKIDVQKAMQEVGMMKPNVCLLWNQKDMIFEIISESYSELLEAKGLLLQKMTGKVISRKTRTFENTDVKHQHLQSTEEANQDMKPIETSVNSINQSVRCPRLELKTKEGLKIQIYAGSITRLDVDCIVNAANENLMHGGGVAAAISDAAGYQFDQESKKYVEDNGSIPVGTCCVTSAGKLPYKCVIHTVGPRWGDYRDKSQCLQLLQDSVRVTFEEADYQKMRSIAIPAISSGIFSVPRDKCVEQYFEATMSFSRTYPFKYLQEIHFVDRDESMVRAIQEAFQSRTKSASTSAKTEKKNGTLVFNGENTVYSKMPLSISFTTVNVSENLQIKIHIGNITDIVADAVVCPQDKDCLSENEIARDIFGKIPDKQPSYKLMKYGDVCSQKLQENSKWKMIIHAVTPVYSSEHAKNYSEFVKTLNTIIQKIIKTADEAKLQSIAIPLLGTGTEEYKTPVEACASSFFKAVMPNKSELMYLNDIYLVLKEEKQEKMYLEDFALINCKITQRPVTNNGKSDDFGKTMKEMPNEGGNCCICMDTPTKPKQLRKCGHIFCKECIEQYFKYKPTCPSCGTIYGKVTGDQPPGTMSIRTNGIRLQGFNDSSGTIVLTYIFNDGKQGEEHPDPGKVYKGINRSGYLPCNKKGRLIAKLLNVAFSRRLVFTIGRSRTTGHDGVITWNDIHHKTRMEGGPARFGYPDPTYLDRVLEELEAKGVTEESADDPEEYKEYSREIRY